MNLLVLEAFVEGLNVGEHAFPIRLLHHHHILHVKERHHAGFLTEGESRVRVRDRGSFILFPSPPLFFSSYLCSSYLTFPDLSILLRLFEINISDIY